MVTTDELSIMRTYITLLLIAIISTVMVLETNISLFRSTSPQESPLESSQESRQFNHEHRCSINSALAQLKQGDTYTFKHHDHEYQTALRVPSSCRIQFRTTIPIFLQTAVLRI